MRLLLATMGCLATVLVTAERSAAQSQARIFDVELGTHVSALPSDEWVDPACGTNGGPPSLVLQDFGDFANCRLEVQTGLREIWFIYDDEWEYIARAYRDPVEIGQYADNTFYGQPIITSLLIDDLGFVQGYRVVTDPRAPAAVREQAYLLFGVYKTSFGGGAWQCEDLPLEALETPVAGTFLKSDCVTLDADRFVSLEGRFFRKPGQDFLAVPREGYFESTVRFEVYSADAVMDASCCQAFLRQ